MKNSREPENQDDETVDSDRESAEDATEEEENIVDQDADNPPAGTPGHPGIDEGTG